MRHEASYGTVSYNRDPSAARPGTDMPLFYFDYDDGEGNGQVRDDIGTDLASLQTARLEAARTITELAADTIPGHSERQLTMVVRDQSGASKLQLSLAFQMRVIG